MSQQSPPKQSAQKTWSILILVALAGGGLLACWWLYERHEEAEKLEQWRSRMNAEAAHTNCLWMPEIPVPRAADGVYQVRDEKGNEGYRRGTWHQLYHIQCYGPVYHDRSFDYIVDEYPRSR